jgi:N-hydroxyarylamine O-acetyltransferase
VIDLDAYFQRINYTGPRTPNLETLNALAQAHVQTIPFENIDVLLGTPIDLEPAALEKKLVHARRGGYCFEQNGLMLEVLRTMGYRVQPISARVRYQRPRDFTPARTHLFVRVELEESWLVDVGAMSSTAALRLNDDGEQPTPHEPRRLLRENGLLYHQVKLNGEWQDVNEFTLEEMPMIDRVVGNWFTSTHPQSHFRNRLLVARAAENGVRIGLLNRELSIRDRTGHAQKQTIATQDELLGVLRAHFGLELPAGTKISWLGADW